MQSMLKICRDWRKNKQSKRKQGKRMLNWKHSKRKRSNWKRRKISKFTKDLRVSAGDLEAPDSDSGENRMLLSVENSAVPTQDANFLLLEKEHKDTCGQEPVKFIPGQALDTTMVSVTETEDGHAIHTEELNELKHEIKYIFNGLLSQIKR